MLSLFFASPPLLSSSHSSSNIGLGLTFLTYFLSEVGIIVRHSSVLSLSLSLSLQLSDMVNQELYSDSQLQVWAIIGLSELVSASYAEDSYGVVQRVKDIHVYYSE